MHLSQHQIPGTQQLVASRKRKILDHGDRGSVGGSSSGKFNGLRPPALRRNSDDDLPLHTPQCSQSGKNVTLDKCSQSNQVKLSHSAFNEFELTPFSYLYN